MIWQFAASVLTWWFDSSEGDRGVLRVFSVTALELSLHRLWSLFLELSCFSPPDRILISAAWLVSVLRSSLGLAWRVFCRFSVGRSARGQLQVY